MTPYIFMEHKGIHIIDLNRTAECLERAALAMKTLAKGGKKIMFVATKKQAREIVQKAAETVRSAFSDRALAGWNDDQLRYDSQICQEDAEYRAYAG
jgi:small subunit ribosomal protein S2